MHSAALPTATWPGIILPFMRLKYYKIFYNENSFVTNKMLYAVVDGGMYAIHRAC